MNDPQAGSGSTAVNSARGANQSAVENPLPEGENCGKECCLSQMGYGQCGVVSEIHYDGPASQRLLALGLRPGCRLKFLRDAPLGDPMMLETTSGVICLRRTEAGLIRVQTDP